MVSFTSFSRYTSMFLIFSGMMSSTIAAGSLPHELAGLLEAAISAGLLNKVGPAIIEKIKSGDLSQIPAGLLDKITSKLPGHSGDGRFVHPCPGSQTSSTAGSKPTNYNELD